MLLNQSNGIMTLTNLTFRESTVAGYRGALFYLIPHQDELQDIYKPACSGSTGDTSTGFFTFASRLRKEMDEAGRQHTSERYKTVINSFRRFIATSEITLAGIDSNLIGRYENYLHNKGLCRNTISFYMRGLRAIYNHAVDKGLTHQEYPFRNVYTGIEKTHKRALPLSAIRKINALDLSPTPALELARDIFIFSFLTRGMSFIDMAFLRKTDLHHDCLTYRRQKTGKTLRIKWEKQMERIVRKYSIKGSRYLLPLIRDEKGDIRRQYRSMAHRINENLKKIGQLLGLAEPLTCYVARHSWASIAKSRDIPVGVISEAMGHDSEKTTLIYLASLDNSKIDTANHKIISLL